MVMMDTVITIQTVGEDDLAAVDRAFEWFRRIENACSRFEPASEVQRLASRVNEAVAVSDILFEMIRFSIALAEETGGAFDPTLGARLEQRGFDRNYRTGERVRSFAGQPATTYRDVQLDLRARTVTLHQPIVFDLGGVAKGFAIDMAARELAPLQNFAIDAGGDLYLAGRNAAGEPWTAGIRHPRDADRTFATLQVSNAAVCTSGDYLRRTPDGGHHIHDPRSDAPADGVASVTVVAPLALVADGLATAAFVLGPERGIALLEKHGVEGLLITTSLEEYRTRAAA